MIAPRNTRRGAPSARSEIRCDPREPFPLPPPLSPPPLPPRRASVLGDDAAVPLVGAGLEDVADLRRREAQLVVRGEEVRPQADPGVGPEVAEDLAPVSSDGRRGSRDVDRDGAAAPLRLARAADPNPAPPARSIRSCVWRSELARIRSTPTSSIEVVAGRAAKCAGTFGVPVRNRAHPSRSASPPRSRTAARAPASP